MNILFYGVLDTISLAMYEDLAEALRKEHSVAFEFCDTIGRKKEAEQIVSERGYPIGMQRPDVMFISDFRFYPTDRGCIVIDLEHGLGSKNDYYYPDTPYESDYLFCSSNWLAKRFSKNKTKFISTGIPKLDRVVKKRSGPKTVLIAPTYNDEYNCMKIIRDNLKDISGKYRVIVKPHQHDKTDWSKYGAETRYDYNISDLFSIADVVVSDVSSAYLEFMALNRPVIVCESDFMRSRKKERPEAHEYYFQNGASFVIKDGSELALAVDKAMTDKFNFQRFINSRKLLSHRGKSIKKAVRELDRIAKRHGLI